MQASVAKVINDAKLELRRRGYDMRIECHDEIVLNVREDRVPDAVRALEETMHLKAVVDGKQWDLPIDPWVGCSWGSYEEW